MLYYALYEHKQWIFLILASTKGLKSINLYQGENLKNYQKDDTTMKPYIKMLESFFNGHHPQHIQFDLEGTPFQQAVWQELLKVPLGTTTSYEALAIQIGKSKAARAVGNAVGHNPVMLLIPCHRVIKKDGSIGGFSSDPKLKSYLLTHEKKLSK